MSTNIRLCGMIASLILMFVTGHKIYKMLQVRGVIPGAVNEKRIITDKTVIKGKLKYMDKNSDCYPSDKKNIHVNMKHQQPDTYGSVQSDGFPASLYFRHYQSIL